MRSSQKHLSSCSSHLFISGGVGVQAGYAPSEAVLCDFVVRHHDVTQLKKKVVTLVPSYTLDLITQSAYADTICAATIN